VPYSLLGTGVELRVMREIAWLMPDDDPSEARRMREAHERGDVIGVEAHVFAEVREDGGEPVRSAGTLTARWLSLNDAVTRELLAVAADAKDHLGTLYGDLRRDGVLPDVSRFAFYCAPFRVEVADDLRQRVARLLT
jgi:hypothetical protein